MRWPHDRDAEYAAIGNSLRSADWHGRARRLVAPGDFFYSEHQLIFEALDQLGDIGPATPATVPDLGAWAELWPLTWPSSLRVRVGALHVLGPYGAPLWAIDRLADRADGRVEQAARTVAARAEERREIRALRDRIDELAS